MVLNPAFRIQPFPYGCKLGAMFRMRTPPETVTSKCASTASGTAGKLGPDSASCRPVVVASVTRQAEAIQEQLFPDGVVLVAHSGPETDPDLFPEELAAMARANPARLREFALGRRCAREALTLLGGPSVAIPVGRFRDPVWPFGYIGSITHCHDFCAAAVARIIPNNGPHSIRGIGLDCEPAAALPNELRGLVCSAEERAWLVARQNDGVVWDRLFFCAKESAYKSIFPETHQFLEFRDVTVQFHPEYGSFEVTLPNLGAIGSRALMGRYAIRKDILLAATTWMEAPACP